MISNCIPDSGYFDSPEFLSLTLHTTTIIATPIHFLGLYFLFLLTVPIVLLPEFAGYSNGILIKLGVPNVYQAVTVLVLLAYVQVSIVAVFENRFHTLCTYVGKKYWAWLRRLWLLFHYLAILAILFLFGMFAPDQNVAVLKILNSLPCLPSDSYSHTIFVLADDHFYHLVMIVFFISSTSSETLTFVGVIVWNTITQLKRQTLSEKTFQMQKTFFIAIVIQIMVPLVMMIIPCIYAWISVLASYHNQASTNFAVIIGSMHGMVSTLVMLLVHRPYREELLFWFWRNTAEFSRNQIHPVHRHVIA